MSKQSSLSKSFELLVEEKKKKQVSKPTVAKPTLQDLLQLRTKCQRNGGNVKAPSGKLTLEELFSKDK